MRCTLYILAFSCLMSTVLLANGIKRSSKFGNLRLDLNELYGSDGAPAMITFKGARGQDGNKNILAANSEYVDLDIYKPTIDVTIKMEGLKKPLRYKLEAPTAGKQAEVAIQPETSSYSNGLQFSYKIDNTTKKQEVHTLDWDPKLQGAPIFIVSLLPMFGIDGKPAHITLSGLGSVASIEASMPMVREWVVKRPTIGLEISIAGIKNPIKATLQAPSPGTSGSLFMGPGPSQNSNSLAYRYEIQGASLNSEILDIGWNPNTYLSVTHAGLCDRKGRGLALHVGEEGSMRLGPAGGNKKIALADDGDLIIKSRKAAKRSSTTEFKVCSPEDLVSTTPPRLKLQSVENGIEVKIITTHTTDNKGDPIEEEEKMYIKLGWDPKCKEPGFENMV